MALNVTHNIARNGTHILAPIGSLDSNTYSILEEKVDSVISQNPSVLIFELENLNYVSSAGIRIIFKAQKSIKQNKGEVVFMNMQPGIKKVFDIINAIPSMKIFSSVNELDDYLDHMQRLDSNQT